MEFKKLCKYKDGDILNFMEKMEILTADPSDFEAIKALMLEALQNDPTAFSVDFDNYSRNSNEWWKNYLFGYIHNYNATMLLSRSENEVNGMIGILFDANRRRSHVASIVWFYVKSGYRHNGIGKKIFEEAMRVIKGKPEIRKITLLVNHPQEHAIKIYKDFGFKIAGTLKNELIINNEPVSEYILECFV